MTKEQEKKFAKLIQPLVEEIIKKQNLNENYGTVLTALVNAFQKAASSMHGSSISNKEMYEDLGKELRLLKLI